MMWKSYKVGFVIEYRPSLKERDKRVRLQKMTWKNTKFGFAVKNRPSLKERPA